MMIERVRSSLAVASVGLALLVAGCVDFGKLGLVSSSYGPGIGAAPEVTLAAVPARAVVQVGEASWYGAELAGAKTASGEPFDPEALTAAHPELPFGTTVTVVNLDNGNSVEVVINDRGPFTEDRIIDVSAAAARKLGFKDNGTTEVRIEADPEVLAAIEQPEA